MKDIDLTKLETAAIKLGKSEAYLEVLKLIFVRMEALTLGKLGAYRELDKLREEIIALAEETNKRDINK